MKKTSQPPKKSSKVLRQLTLSPFLVVVIIAVAVMIFFLGRESKNSGYEYAHPMVLGETTTGNSRFQIRPNTQPSQKPQMTPMPQGFVDCTKSENATKCREMGTVCGNFCKQNPQLCQSFAQTPKPSARPSLQPLPGGTNRPAQRPSSPPSTDFRR